MKTTIPRSLIFLGIFACIFASLEATLVGEECLDSSDCGKGHCCIIMPMRYSVPHCVAMRQENDICRPNNEPFNGTLGYPDNKQLSVTNIYSVLCPCADGLSCDAKVGGYCVPVAVSGH